MVEDIKNLDSSIENSVASKREASSYGSVHGPDACGTRRISPDARAVGQVSVAIAIHNRIERVWLTGLKFSGECDFPMAESAPGEKTSHPVPHIKICG